MFLPGRKPHMALADGQGERAAEVAARLLSVCVHVQRTDGLPSSLRNPPLGAIGLSEEKGLAAFTKSEKEAAE